MTLDIDDVLKFMRESECRLVTVEDKLLGIVFCVTLFVLIGCLSGQV